MHNFELQAGNNGGLPIVAKSSSVRTFIFWRIVYLLRRLKPFPWIILRRGCD